MNVYTVHVKGSAEDRAALEESIFVRDGFSWAALILGPLWLVWRRLWLALLIWIALEAMLGLWASFASPAPSAVLMLQVLMHVALGFEASEMRRYGLARRRFAMVGLVSGRRLSDAERAYFLQRAEAMDERDSQGVVSPSPISRTPGMVGLFPSSGA